MATERLETFTRAGDPESERALLSREIKHKAERLGGAEHVERAAHETVRDYGAASPSDVLEEGYAVSGQERSEIVLALSPEPHDEQMSELLSIVQEKGIKNALSVVADMNNPHIADDFHRFLIQYLKTGHAEEAFKKHKKLYKTLAMTLFSVTLPENPDDDNRTRQVKEIVGAMEQFYAGMRSITAAGENRFAFEIAVPATGVEARIYLAVPDRARSLLEKHLFATFPHAVIREETDDYNIFVEGGAVCGATARYATRPIYPLRLAESFDEDPLNVLLGSFAKSAREGEGAAIQFVCNPDTGGLLAKYKRALGKVRGGTPAREATDIPVSFGQRFVKAVGNLVGGSPAKPADGAPRDVDTAAVEAIERKVRSTLMAANIRIVTSAETAERAEHMCEEFESAFNQFEDAAGNSLSFARLRGRALKELRRAFTYRTFERSRALPLSLGELATMAHVPSGGTAGAPHVAHAGATEAPAPGGLPMEGLVLGMNSYRGLDTAIRISPEDRLRHFYTIGQTGTGKTTLLKNMIVQDIQAGEGVCMIDPHGADIEDVLGAVPPERADDVIYFEPGYAQRVFALNMLEYDQARPEQKTFVVNELFSIFQKLYAAVPESMGPIFEQYFRNAAMLVLEYPESGSTLLDISRVLVDEDFRAEKLEHAQNPVVVQFWREIAQKAGGEAALQNVVPYITSKFDVFTANDIIRPIIAQQHSTFDMRRIMDERKILLVNLSKGQLGEINAHLLGLILVGKILMAALSRTGEAARSAPPFYLYIDEFQNVTTSSITTILSEARKYKLALTVAHQFIGQLQDDIKDAVFGNVGSLAAFRVGAEDAAVLEHQFAPVFSARDLMNIENRHAHIKLLAGGQPVKPFTLTTLPPQKSDPARADMLKQASYERYGRPRAEVESEIARRYRNVLA